MGDNENREIPVAVVLSSVPKEYKKNMKIKKLKRKKTEDQFRSDPQLKIRSSSICGNVCVYPAVKLRWTRVIVAIYINYIYIHIWK